jgi:thiol-disulfide isomerase/thioredoxin
MKRIRRIAVMATMAAFIAGVLTSPVVLGQNFPTTPVSAPLKYKVVVLTFSQANCPYCRDAAPTWDLLRKDGVSVVNYDVDKDRAYFEAFRVDAVPTTLVTVQQEGLSGYRQMLRVGGSRPLAEYQAMIKRAKGRIAAGVKPWPADLSEAWPPPAPAEAP